MFCSNQLHATGPCDPSTYNAVACENTLTGSSASSWDIVDNGNVPDPDLVGFATAMSVNKGSAISFKIRTSASSFKIDIYRIGYYGGKGARLVLASLGGGTFGSQSQPTCASDSTTHLIDCGNWSVTTSWTVPSTAVSGIYIAKLTRLPADGRTNHIIFVVRDDSSTAQVVYQTSDPTWQAYNVWGNYSLYVGSTNPSSCNDSTWDVSIRARKVSYNRPFAMTAAVPTCSPDDPSYHENGWFRDHAHGFFGAEYPMVRFLEANGVDMTYISGVDASTTGSLLLSRHLILSVGHDEYWTGDQRSNFEAARDAGVNLAFFSGNEVYQKTRFEPSIDGSGTLNRTMVDYKGDSDSSPIYTGAWRGNMPGKDGAHPSNALTGTSEGMTSDDERALATPDSRFRATRFWRNINWTGAPSTLGTNVIGYEWDSAPNDVSTPTGLFRLSETVGPPATDSAHQSLYTNPQHVVHNLTLYRAPSGALVFGAGTVQWSWGLETTTKYLNFQNTEVTPPNAPDARLKQATINLLIDMGATLGTTLQPGLISSSASTDTTAPTITISTPAPSGSDDPQAISGSSVTVSGSASDTGGPLAVVAAVDLSFDGGVTWSQASLNAEASPSWSYTWKPNGQGIVTIRARAIDDSGNVGTTATQRVVVTQKQCPCSIFNDAPITAYTFSSDTTSIQLGTRYLADAIGKVHGIKYYQPTEMSSATHTGYLWSPADQVNPVATSTFASSSTVGWHSSTFSSPVAINPYDPYIATYWSNIGYIGNINDGSFHFAGVDSPPVHALHDGNSSGGAPNGVYAFGTAFPNQYYDGGGTYSYSNNYYTDLIFKPTACRAESLTKNLLGWWTFDELSGATAVDSASSPHNLNATGTTIGAGRFGNGREFVGDSPDKIEPSSGSVDIAAGTTAITLGAWVYPKRSTNFILGDTAPNANWGRGSIFMDSSYPHFGYTSTYHNDYQCNKTLTLNQWSHVVFTYTYGDASSIKCYVNGSQITSGSWINGAGSYPLDTSYSVSFGIGHWPGTPAVTTKYWFEGTIDEPFIYTRALSRDEVLGLYTNSGSDASTAILPAATLGSNRKGKWSFSETGSSLSDSSGNSFTGTAMGTTVVDGVLGNARRFNGTSDKIAVITGSSNLALTSGEISIGAWLSPERSENYVMGYASSPNWGLYSMFTTADGRPAFGFYGAGSNQYYRCNTVLPANRMTSVIFSYTMGAGNLMRCYVNGSFVEGAWILGDGNSTPDSSGLSSMGFDIGHWYGATGTTNDKWFKGTIDEPFVISHSLTADEVASAFNQACR